MARQFLNDISATLSFSSLLLLLLLSFYLLSLFCLCRCCCCCCCTCRCGRVAQLDFRCPCVCTRALSIFGVCYKAHTLTERERDQRDARPRPGSCPLGHRQRLQLAKCLRTPNCSVCRLGLATFVMFVQVNERS